MSNPSKQKGTSWETQIVAVLTASGFRAKRKALSGANDKGDIEIEGLPWLVIEAKNWNKPALAQWVDEARKEAVNAKAKIGVVWHHRARKGSPLDGFVTMSGETFMELMKIADK